MMRTLLSLLAVLAAISSSAQTPAPVIMQPASAPVQSATAAPAYSDPAGKPGTEIDLTAELKTLQEIKAANDETLKRQQAELELLDVLIKDAEQVRIFSRRG